MTVQFIAEGRIVWGHPGNSQKKTDPQTNQVKKNAQGEDVEQWVFGLAIPKEKFNANIWPHLYNEALTVYPSGTFPPKFSWKFKDGDTETDKKGKRYSEYEGRAGNMILTVSTEAFAPPLYKFTNGQYVQITAAEIKCGDYVAVSVNAKYNGATGLNTPGLYINPQGVVLTGYGTEIITSGFDPDEAFAGFTPTTPAGASATPVMPSAPMPGAMHPQPAAQPAAAPMPQQYAAPQAAPAPVAPVQQAPAAPLPAPAHDFVDNAGQMPSAPAAPPQYAAPAQPGGLPPGVPGIPTGR